MSQVRLSRRERYRLDTIAEIKQHAMGQIAAGGVPALSLNAIAKEMAVSGGAIYRYFASRDDLLIALVVDAFDSFADALEQAAAGDHQSDRARFYAVADAYRQWALDDPNRYRLAWNTRPGSGLVVPHRVVPAAERSMNVLLAALAPRRGRIRRTVAAGWSGRPVAGVAPTLRDITTAVGDAASRNRGLDPAPWCAQPRTGRAPVLDRDRRCVDLPSRNRNPGGRADLTAVGQEPVHAGPRPLPVTISSASLMVVVISVPPLGRRQDAVHPALRRRRVGRRHGWCGSR